MQKTAKQQILEVLAVSKQGVPVHEFQIYGVSQTAISARLREMARVGQVVGHRLEGENFKRWTLAPNV